MTWPRMLEARLKLYNLKVVESGICSRTTEFDDAGNDSWMGGCEDHYFNGAKHFPQEFVSASPCWVVFLLGTNDLRERIRTRFNDRGCGADLARQITTSVANLAERAKFLNKTTLSQPAELGIIVITPPEVKLNEVSRELGYDEHSVKTSQELGRAFEAMCTARGYHFVNPNVDMTHSADGVHVTQSGNVAIAEAVWAKMRPLLGPVPQTRDFERELKTPVPITKRSRYHNLFPKRYPQRIQSVLEQPAELQVRSQNSNLGRPCLTPNEDRTHDGSADHRNHDLAHKMDVIVPKPPGAPPHYTVSNDEDGALPVEVPEEHAPQVDLAAYSKRELAEFEVADFINRVHVALEPSHAAEFLFAISQIQGQRNECVDYCINRCKYFLALEGIPSLVTAFEAIINKCEDTDLRP